MCTKPPFCETELWQNVLINDLENDETPELQRHIALMFQTYSCSSLLNEND